MTVIDYKFAFKNKYIWPGLVDELYACMKYLRMNDMVRIAKSLNHEGSHCSDQHGNYVTMLDLACLYGYNSYAESIGPIWFCAGPELSSASKDRYKIIESTALHWCMDMILNSIARHGHTTLREAQLPL